MSRNDTILNVRIVDFLDRFSSMPDLRDRVIMQLLFETGCTVHELCTIHVKDFVPAKDYENLNKVIFENRHSVISQTLSSELKKYILFRGRKDSDYLFSQNPKNPLSVKRVEQLVDELFDSKITPMQIRYMHIINAASRGLSADAISEQTGLSRQRILQILDTFKVTYKQSYSLFFEEYGGKNV